MNFIKSGPGMSRFNIFVLLFLVFCRTSALSENTSSFSSLCIVASHQDTILENQVLYNGKIWKNLYSLVEDDQFLFSNEFLPGTITISGKTFSDINIKYDLFEDEILTPSDTGGILQLNKELVDSFSVSFQNRTYHFIKMQEDSLMGSQTYFNVLYKGDKCSLLLWYNKKIDKLADEGKYDKFYLITRLYFVDRGKIYQISGERDLLKILSEDHDLVKDFIKKNKLRLSEKKPESFIPVIRYYDTIRQ